MARKYVSMKNMRFMLNDVHNINELTNHPLFEHFDAESFDMMLDAAKQLSDKYLFPHYEDMDRNPPELVDGEVKVHHSVRPLLDAMAEGGWIGMSAPMELGGMQSPAMLLAAVGFIMSAANNGAMLFSGLTSAAANLLVSFGTDEQKAYYLPSMYGGKWQGTMALTEPQAGSSLSDITTVAYPQADGTYKIKGQKIYISAGDYSDIDNVIHFTLARIEGAPAGTKGISLFIVPKYREEAEGKWVSNDVTTAGVYHKLGQKGAPALHLMYGEKDDCVGHLLGEENRGLSYMFQMMNEARISVGLGGAAVASAAYYASLHYANERPQGRYIMERDLSKPQVNIIQHPDVKRMLLLQKAIMEGGLSLVMQAAKYADLAHTTEGEEKEKYEFLLELLTPMVKTYPSEFGVTSISTAVQVFGGGGFCEDFPAENYYRDIRIYPIYEGTTGIQSMDLLGRKVTMKQGKALRYFMAEVTQTIETAKTHDDLKPYAEKLAEEMQRLQGVTMHLVGFAMKGEIDRFLADANLFMEMSSIIAVGWQWLIQGIKAKEAMLTQNPQGDELNFLQSKIHTMKFFFHYEVPKTLGLEQRLKDNEVLTIIGEKEWVI
ncbi:MAG: acyl-CoA dehydrogenase [Bacteroidota bacterium]